MKSPDTAPDIVAEDTSIIKSDAAAGYLEPLDTQVAGWSDWKDKFIENLKEGVTGEDGKVYGVPATSDTRGIWYNKELLAQAGAGAFQACELGRSTSGRTHHQG